MRTILAFYLALSAALFANGGGYSHGIAFTGSLAPFTAEGTENVQIMDEQLTIDLYPDFARVKVRYEMHNVSGKSTKVTFGFPVEDMRETMYEVIDTKEKKPLKINPQYCRDYSIKVNGKPIKAKYTPEAYATGKIKPFQSSEVLKGIEAWYVSSVRFKADTPTIIEISYDSDYSFSTYFVSDDFNDSSWSFQYRLSSGGIWHGPIKKGKITINNRGVDPKHIKVSKPTNQFIPKDGNLVWEFQDLEPTIEDDITVVARIRYSGVVVFPKGEDEAIYVYTIGDQIYGNSKDFKILASSELPSVSGITYEVQNIGRTEYKARLKQEAWSEGVEGDGIGETITITPNAGTKVTHLLMMNGYRSNFRQNNRVKDLTITINDQHEVKRMLYDHQHQQLIDLGSIPNKISKITLRIDSVYKGTHFEDTCLTDITLLNKLEKMPEGHGAR
ncbi:NADase-type glycan-binding domain-containing protein [Rubritalea marina]|uniref:NADase-type glycan-binding domain-containing protein n=1 Tax=Rubritalea marina TaxID=361055 RepID=UPI00038075AF|nr:DUF4424 family protein [Rubritalea marina]